MGKGEIALYEQFLLFPQCFQKACFPGVSKGVIVWEWVIIMRRLYKIMWQKEKNCGNKHLLLFSQCFLSFRDLPYNIVYRDSFVTCIPTYSQVGGLRKLCWEKEKTLVTSIFFHIHYNIKSFNCHMHPDMSLRRRLWKTLLEKEKMLVTSIFSFFNNVFLFSLSLKNLKFQLHSSSIFTFDKNKLLSYLCKKNIPKLYLTHISHM